MAVATVAVASTALILIIIYSADGGGCMFVRITL